MYGHAGSLYALVGGLLSSLLAAAYIYSLVARHATIERVAGDDFGTGYPSLSYQRRFPIDVLKIDQSFVSDIALEADGAAIVVSIITLAHSLRLNVIAEGVETAEQLAFLREHGCDEVQGYFFSRPVGALEFGQLLEHGTCSEAWQPCGASGALMAQPAGAGA